MILSGKGVETQGKRPHVTSMDMSLINVPPVGEDASANAIASSGPGRWDTFARGILSGMNPRTRASYERAYVRYRAWCADNGHDWRVETSLYAWLFERVRGGMRHGTLGKEFHAVVKIARLADLGWGRDRLSEFKRSMGKLCEHGNGSRALTIGEVRDMAGVCRPAMRVGLLLGFAGGLRISEILGLKAADATAADGGVRLFIRESKGDRDGKGVTVFAPDFAEFRLAAEVAAVVGADPAAPLVGLSQSHFRRLFRQACEDAGVDHAGLSTHGMRAGCATTAVNGNLPLPVLQRHLRHANASTTARYYRDREGRETGAAVGRAFREAK